MGPIQGFSGRARLLCGIAGLSIASLSVAGSALADTGAAEAAPTQIQEVVVTATRQSLTLSKTPAAVTALSADALAKSGVSDITNLQNVVPNLSVGDQFGVNRTFIRGIGMTSIDLGADGAVAFLQDGAIVSRPAAQLTGFFDVDRVEVLRGPQGTLYGRGATAGAVNIVTKQPTADTNGYIRATYGDYNQKTVQAALGGTLIENKLLGRIAVNYDTHDGYGKNLYNGADIDDRNAKAVRGALTWLATPDLTATLSFGYFNEHDNNYAFHYFGPTVVPDGSLPTRLVGGKTIFDYYAARNRNVDFRNIYSATNPINRRHGADVTGTVEWKKDAWDVKSITSYRDFTRKNVDDLSVSDGVIYGRNDYDEKSQSFSEEVQANYKAERWNILGGAMYFHEDNYGSVLVPTTNISAVLDPTNALPAAVHTAMNSGKYQQVGSVETNAYGVYLQGTYNITDKLKATAGLRYSYEERTGSGSFIFTVLGVNIPTDQNKGWDAVTPKFTLDYQATPTTLFYGTVARGFKSGVINIGSTNPVINPEYVWDYEGGVKTSFFDRRLSVAGSVFYYDYTDLQVGFVNAASVVSTINAASARNYGAEIELRAKVTPRLTLDFYATALNARFSSFLNSDYRQGYAQVNLKGKQLPNAPDYSAQFGATYDMPFSTGADLELHADVNWQDKVYFTEFNNSDAVQKARSIINLNAHYTLPNNRWSIEIFAHNVTDRTVIANNIIAAPLFANVRVGSLLPPRTVGVTLGYKF
jgi:iron complex outermembrane receptor protein